MQNTTLATLAILLAFAGPGTHAQTSPDISDLDLEGLSGGRLVRVGTVSGDRHVVTLPLELYVARVLTGEGEPRAADAAQQALAIAIRTYALANVDRHGREGFDLCDTTHCQVLRATASPAARRAAAATAGQVLTWRGQVAEVFYSASCGGRSEAASQVWPVADYPYLRSSKDDVHDHDEPWTVELPLDDVQRALERAGFAGRRLRDVRIAGRNSSGRVTRLKLSGLRPDVVSGAEFRMAIGAGELRSTSFEMKKDHEMLRVTGQGYGHGVGLCVIGAGRRAARGDGVRAILDQYYPGLALIQLRPEQPAPFPPPTVLAAATAPAVAAPPRPGVRDADRDPFAAPRAVPAAPPGLSAAKAAAPPSAAVPASAASRASAVAVRVPPVAPITGAELERIGLRAHDDLSKMLGTSVAPVTIQLHETLDSFRSATGRPWWVSYTATGAVIDLAPAAVLADRDGLVATVRVAVADVLVAAKLSDRPAWVRVGAARYFGRPGGAAVSRDTSRVRCPTDPELLLAVSASAQREAEKRAEACFARALARGQDWRDVR